MVRRRARISALVACALAIAGAGAVVVLARDGTPPRTGRAVDGRIAIAIDDFRLTPQVVHVRAGTLRIDLRNEGRLGHAFHVRKDGRLWIEAKRLLPGERRVITRRLERGNYRAFDPLSNFEELGLYGTLSVR